MKFYLLALVIGSIIFSGFFFDYFGLTLDLVYRYHKGLTLFIGRFFFLSLLVFAIIYFFATAFSLPIGTILTLIGGYLFGIIYGFSAVIIGATFGALTLFIFVSRFSSKISTSAGNSSEIFSNIKVGIERNLWSYLFFIRFFPIFPFWLVNIAPAILGVRIVPYFVTTFLGIMPGTLFIIIIGSGIDDILSEDSLSDQTLFKNGQYLFSLCALSLFAVFPILYKKLKKSKSN